MTVNHLTQIADLEEINKKSMGIFCEERLRLVCVLVFVCLIVITSQGQSSSNDSDFTQSQTAFDNGNFVKAIQLAEASLNKNKILNQKTRILKSIEIIAYSQTTLGRFEEAESTIQKALQIVSESEAGPLQKSSIYFCASWLKRRQRQIPEAIAFSKQALSVNPNNSQIQGEFYLNIGRILFSQSFDVSAIIWLEKAEKLHSLQKLPVPVISEVYRFLSHAWFNKGNLKNALFYSEKFVNSVEKTGLTYKFRQALSERGNLLSATGQKAKAYHHFKKGLESALKNEDSYYSRSFLNTIILNLLYDNDSVAAADYLPQLVKLDKDGEFSFEVDLIKAVLSKFAGKNAEAEQIFRDLEKRKKSSLFLLLSWKIIIAEKNREWEKLITLTQELTELAEKYQYRDELPRTHLLFAKAYFHLNQIEKAENHLEKSISLIEELRKFQDTNLSLGVSETYHDAYRLLTQIRFNNFQEAFALADLLKGRILKDRIENSPLRATSEISNELRQRLGELSSRFIDNQNVSIEIEDIEKNVTTKIPELKLEKPDLSILDKVTVLKNVAIISYFFTLDEKLLAFVWEKGKSLKAIELPVSESEVKIIAAKAHQDIKNGVFFKRDGRGIFDKLLKPLGLTSNHLIIVPDKSLWKIPFQALSSDGEKYLIEEKLISYAPSVSIMLEQLKASKPNRQTLQVFANSSFENKLLQYVNSEASTVAGIYNSKPIIKATAEDFSRVSDKFDILHFSMHAEVAGDQPLDSFLGFRKIGNDDGRLTVEELLNIKLKNGSFVFLASCDTNKVFNGEGLVSLAWGMMASGATTVISAQWEANDKSTAIFTKTFYEHYRKGNSSAESMQKASLELIKNKSGDMHEPYYWADFTLNGDFR